MFHTEVVPDKTTHVIPGAFFNGSPICIIELVLILRRLVHQNIVPDFVAFSQGKTGGVKAFKNELGIVMLIESNANDLQLADGSVKVVDRNLLFQDLITEETVIQRQIGCLIIILFLTK